MKIKVHGRTLILCYVYNTLAHSSYQWTSDEFPNLMQKIEDIKSANEVDQCDIINTGKKTFSTLIRKQFPHQSHYEIQILEKIFELKLTEHGKIQLDVVLSSNSELIVTCQLDKLITKELSDHF